MISLGEKTVQNNLIVEAFNYYSQLKNYMAWGW